MSLDRRHFLWTMGTAAGALSLVRLGEMVWPTPEPPVGPGWSPGLEELETSACLVCPARCGIQGRVVDGSLVRITGSPFHPMSRGGICPRGVAGVQTLYHPDRLLSPRVREGERGSGRWREVTRDEALGQLSQRLSALRGDGRPESLSAVVGYCAGSMEDVWRQFFRAFGSPNLVSDAYDDGTDAVMAAMHGIPRRPGYDLENADTVLSFGASLFESWWSPLQAFVAFARSASSGEHQRRFIQVDHRFSHTAAYTDEWVGVKPGTHWVLALGIAYVILRDRLQDEDFLARHVTGFEDFTDARGRPKEGFRSLVMRRYRTEEVSALTGVGVERITELARAFAGSTRSVALCGRDVTLAPGGLAAGMAVHSLNLLVGSVGRPGGVLFAADAPLAPLAPVVLDAVARNGHSRTPIGGTGPSFGAGDGAARFARTVAAGEDQAPEVLLVHGADPLGASHRADAWTKALEKIPLVVSFSPFLDETASYADVIIPELLPWERWQDAPTPWSYPYPAWGLARPLVTPPDGPVHVGEVLFALGRILGGSVAGSLPYDNFEDLLKGRGRGLFDASRGGTFALDFETENRRQREARGWWLPSQPDFDSFWSELVDRGGWVDPFYDFADPTRFARTSDRRIALLPAAVVADLASDRNDRQPYAPRPDQPEAEGGAFPLRLLPYRVSTLASDTLGLERWLAEQPAVSPDTQWIPWVSIAPETAAEMGLSANRMVRIVSPRGAYEARLQISVGIAPGTVVAPIGPRHPDGTQANPLRLLDDSVDDLTGLPAWFTTRVRLEQLQRGARG